MYNGGMRVVFLMGPIASGKGTQADMLANKLGLFHLETSKFLEAQMNKPEFSKQREQYHSGQWMEPVWVAGIVAEEAGKIFDQGRGLVFSGSPRTLEETEVELPFFEKKVGKENLLFFNVNLSEQEAVKRSVSRRICKVNRHPIPGFSEFEDLTACPEDGSELIRKSLDKPEIIARRYQEYLNRTVPIFDFLKERGYDVIEINGEQPIADVFNDIVKHLAFIPSVVPAVNP
ncbi:MAG: hypothetical protein A3C71_01315 [Candidatus Yanofskybacteria bacterium RIFCSPHIGHO2_02_FULL_43_15c]|uniref:Adenylate kinase n=2 Tax=Candidatus Yanofskyibacteriota TaxID=1752733 RepID=A0A1F8H1L4_9BACT|nr:MAG: hypothetical protein A3C71_01315 [Candidatus Yanofskybacteria bacterium RIFCSPHIGHO2_02_FULL_43_15c]OGN30766.1 MAG: hypothetical protein A3I92_00460 [Candidatus Yanofskybacteria bacterium RIFCSPLOWO2_02_FULL_43_10b]